MKTNSVRTQVRDAKMELIHLFQIFLLTLIFLLAASSARSETLVADNSMQMSCTGDCEDQFPAPTLAELVGNTPPSEYVELRLNVPALRLDLYIQGKYVKSYQVAVGKPSYPTPIHDLNISQIVWNPWWIPPDSPWAAGASKTPPGPKNPLGVVKLMMEDGVRIHGTNNPASIGQTASHACIRMHNKDAMELAWIIQTRYSEKKDESLLNLYAKRRSQSFFVNLKAAVPLYIEYNQVERKDGKLLIHPNLYGKKGFQDQLMEQLEEHPELASNATLVKRLETYRSRRTVEIPMDQVATWTPAAKKATVKKAVPSRNLANATPQQ